MPGSFRVDPDLRLLIVEITGHTSFAEVMELANRILQEAPRNLDVLVDLSGVVKSEVTPEHMKGLARERWLEVPNRIAFVATKPDVYGRARAFQLVAEAHGTTTNVGVFHTLDEAMRWLRDEPSEPKSS